MLAERVKEWTEEWKWQGIQEGFREGFKEGFREGFREGLHEAREEARVILRQILEERFGPLSEEACRSLEAISSIADLMRLSSRLGSAPSLAALGLTQERG